MAGSRRAGSGSHAVVLGSGGVRTVRDGAIVSRMVSNPFTRPLLPISHDWTSTSWEAAFAAADRLPSKLQAEALRCLRDVFPPSLTAMLQADGHPVVGEQLTNRGRLELLELGLAIAVVGLNKNELGRLRHPDQYRGAAAELRALLLPVRAGARLTRPPVAKGKKVCEYIAEFPTGLRVAVEAKRPNVGERDLDMQVVEQSVFMELMCQLDWLHEVLPSARATLILKMTDHRALGNRHGINEGLVRSVVAAAVERVRLAVHQGPPAQPVDLGALGSLVIQEDKQIGQLQFDATSRRTVKDGFIRIRRTILNKAAQQIRDSGLTGLILLDLEDDRAGVDGSDLLARWADTKDALGAIILIERHTIDGRACNGAHVVPGPRFDEIAEAIGRGLDYCAAGHVHYTPLSTPSDPCPASWLPAILTHHHGE